MHPDQLTPAGFVERAEPLRGKEPKYTGLRHEELQRSHPGAEVVRRWSIKGETNRFLRFRRSEFQVKHIQKERAVGRIPPLPEHKKIKEHSTALLSVSGFDVFPGCSAIVLHLLPPISSVPCLKVLHWIMHYAQAGRLLQTLEWGVLNPSRWTNYRSDLVWSSVPAGKKKMFQR